MKKAFFAAIVFSCLIVKGQSQLPAQKVEFGLSLGANLTNIHGNGMATGYGSGFTAGAFSHIPLSAKWNLQPEVLFNYVNTKKGAGFLEYYVNSGNENAAEKVNLNYISVPVLLGYKLNKTFTLNAGPQYSSLIYENDNLLQSNKASYQRSDLGIVAGGQVHLENLSFYARYVLGVMNVNAIDDRYKWQSRQVQLGLNLKLF